MSCMRGSRGGERGPDPPEKSPKYRVSLQYWSRFPESHKATKPVFNVGLSSPAKRQLMAFRWRNDVGPLIMVFGLSLTSSTTKKSCQSSKLDPL